MSLSEYSLLVSPSYDGNVLSDKGTSFWLQSASLQPVQTDNTILSLVGSSLSVTCHALVLLLDTGVCSHTGCVNMSWVQNSTHQIAGPSTMETLNDGFLTVSRVLQLDTLTWDSSGIYTCQISYGGSRSEEMLRISLSGKNKERIITLFLYIIMLCFLCQSIVNFIT